MTPATGLRVHLVDGTFELFRAFFGAPPATAPDGREVGATRGLLRSLASLLRESGVSHVGVAFDHVIESFRNDLFPGYKTGEGIDPRLLGQFELAERASRALGLCTWAMVEYEADDAMATAAALAAADPRVSQVRICSPDKDLCQCVEGSRVIQVDRMRRVERDDAGVRARFGVGPESIPDFLALVGDDADGIPGVPRWGEKSAGAVLARYQHLEAIPDRVSDWRVQVRGADALAASLREHRREAELYRVLATLRRDVPYVERELDTLRWKGPDQPALAALCEELGESNLLLPRPPA